VEAVVCFRLLLWWNTDSICSLDVTIFRARILNRQGFGFERLFLALASMVSGIWLFELFYYFGYPDTHSSYIIMQGLFSLNFNTDNGQTFPLLWCIIMIVLPLYGLRYMAISKSMIAASLLSLGVWSIWIASGYPQWVNPQWWPAQPTLINLIPLTLMHTQSSVIVFWGLFLNSLSKVVVILPAMLFNKKAVSVKARVS
jgi:hypothetical protein